MHVLNLSDGGVDIFGLGGRHALYGNGVAVADGDRTDFHGPSWIAFDIGHACFYVITAEVVGLSTERNLEQDALKGSPHFHGSFHRESAALRRFRDCGH